MRIAILIYTHRHGIDLYPVYVPDGMELPPPTNELLSSLGVHEPELDIRDDEYAEWSGFWKPEEIPTLKPIGPFEWDPEGASPPT